MPNTFKTFTAKNDTLLIISLTFLSFLLRIPKFSSPLIIDEAITFNRYRNVPWKDLLLNYYDTNQHTLFSLLSNLSIRIFGENEIAFRLPSLFAGLLAIPLLYKIAVYFFESKPAAIISCILLAISSPHLNYSQDGRGYALTVFLALLLIYSSIQLVQTKRESLWGTSIALSGFCLILTLPSNAFFLAASGIFCLTLIFNLKNKDKTLFKQKFFCLATSYIALLIFTLIYLFNIYEGLKWGVDNYSNPEIRLKKYYEISQFLVSPWGSWFYLPLIYGWFYLNTKKLNLYFLSLIIVPLLLTVITDVVGFARIYIFSTIYFFASRFWPRSPFQLH